MSSRGRMLLGPAAQLGEMVFTPWDRKLWAQSACSRKPARDGAVRGRGDLKGKKPLCLSRTSSPAPHLRVPLVTVTSGVRQERPGTCGRKGQREDFKMQGAADLRSKHRAGRHGSSGSFVPRQSADLRSCGVFCRWPQLRSVSNNITQLRGTRRLARALGASGIWPWQILLLTVTLTSPDLLSSSQRLRKKPRLQGRVPPPPRRRLPGRLSISAFISGAVWPPSPLEISPSLL